MFFTRTPFSSVSILLFFTKSYSVGSCSVTGCASGSRADRTDRGSSWAETSSTQPILAQTAKASML